MCGKNYVIAAIIGAVVILAIAAIGASRNPQTETIVNNSINKTEVVAAKPDKIEVFLFHPTQRCITCITIGKFAGETVAEFFQPELKGGQIEFREINIDLPENKILAQKFQASGSSLRINVIANGQDNISEDTYVWRLTQNEAQFKSYLKNKLDNLLGK
ncbi:MAG: nitrophenyl compound nitroreductase subunit ArsF family protein [Candidatus Parcubacteria bacterium]|nr:nitrophenyl compound nitroreductase subunit ArsF family protein [Candidatus Parcubacteria bacterium]